MNNYKEYKWGDITVKVEHAPVFDCVVCMNPHDVDFTRKVNKTDHSIRVEGMVWEDTRYLPKVIE